MFFFSRSSDEGINDPVYSTSPSTYRLLYTSQVVSSIVNLLALFKLNKCAPSVSGLLYLTFSLVDTVPCVISK